MKSLHDQIADAFSEAKVFDETHGNWLLSYHDNSGNKHFPYNETHVDRIAETQEICHVKFWYLKENIHVIFDTVRPDFDLNYEDPELVAKLQNVIFEVTQDN